MDQWYHRVWNNGKGKNARGIGDIGGIGGIWGIGGYEGYKEKQGRGQHVASQYTMKGIGRGFLPVFYLLLFSFYVHKTECMSV